MTVSGFLPVPSNRSDNTFSRTRAFEQEHSVGMQYWKVDSDYVPAMGMEIVAGRNFDPARPTDSSCILINEAAVKLWGFTDPINQKVYTLNAPPTGEVKPEHFIELTIVGVVKDFHYSSLRDNIGALCMQLGKSRGLAAVRLKGAQEVAEAVPHGIRAAPAVATGNLDAEDAQGDRRDDPAPGLDGVAPTAGGLSSVHE